MKSRSRTFVVFFSIVGLFAVALVLARESLGSSAAIVAAVFLLIGSVLGFRRVREDQSPPGVARWPSLVNALPRGWARWMMGEDKDKS